MKNYKDEHVEVISWAFSQVGTLDEISTVKIYNLNDNLHPTSIIKTEQIFSLLVLGDTLPKPTDVSDEKVKYKAVTYLKFNANCINAL